MTPDNPSRPVTDVAFVVYNYTTKLLLKKQLDFFKRSVFSFTYSLTVVDDASLDGSCELISTYRGACPVFLDECQGVGRAFNHAIALAPDSRYLCLLQTDVNLTVEALESLVQHCDTHRDVKVCAPVICFPGGQPQKFVFNPGLLTMYSGSFDKRASRSMGRKLRSTQKPVRVAGIIGPFLFCSRDLIVDDRLFDNRFQHYFCDMELAQRLMHQGVVCEVLPGYSLVRLGGQTSFIRHPELYYSMKHAYINKFHGRFHADLCLKRDILKAWFKVFSYNVSYKLSPSSKLSFQIARYADLKCILEKVQRQVACGKAAIDGTGGEC
jgi:GT2 family glycosyltransferase